MAVDFPRKRTSITQNFPFPEEGEVVYETAPCFVWVPVKGCRSYRVIVKNAEGEIVFEECTDKNYIYDDKEWESGRYSWDVMTEDGLHRGEYSFVISENAVAFRRPVAKILFDHIPENKHPRHLFAAEDIPGLLKDHEEDLEILKRNVELAYEHGMPEPPKFQYGEEELPYREYFGQYRDYCDRDLVACSLQYALTGDIEAGNHAKKLLFAICEMNPLGPCSLMGEWGDEVGLSNARCLPAVYDLLYDLLDEKQRSYVASTVAVYAGQCADRIRRINYAENPSDNHVGRIPAYLGEAAMVLKGSGAVSEETLISWLETALDIYNGIFPFYGCPDGSWAQGAFYSSSYTKWYLPFFSAVERFSGCSLMQRPFYMRYPQYLIHFCDPKYENHPFGDGYWCHSEDEEWPGFFAQNPYRVYAENFGPELAMKKWKEANAIDYFRLHLLDIFLPKSKTTFPNQITGEVENCALFPYGGYAVMHTDLESENDICVMIRSSRYTADSHRHADQGSFALYAGGKALISPSGYFGRQYGSKHHFEWTMNTIAHNVLLPDGKGQLKTVDAVGKILSFDREKRECVMDLTAAYENLARYQRTICLRDNGIIVSDLVESEIPVEICYPLHTLVQPEANGECVTVERENSRLTIIPQTGDLTLQTIKDQFEVDLNEGEPPQYHVTMPDQYHIYYTAPKACRHEITVQFLVEISDH